MIALSVNLNKIALIRNSRDTTNPSVPAHAQMCIDAGADGITVHPRPDQRHIRAQDCHDLAAMLSVEFNIEGNPFTEARRSERAGVGDYPGFMALVREIRPAQCTLVPDGDGQLTSDHGFDLKKDGDRVAPLVAELKSLGIRTSLFMDPDPEQIRLAAQTGTDRIELYTESYAQACKTGDNTDAVFQQRLCNCKNALAREDVSGSLAKMLYLSLERPFGHRPLPAQFPSAKSDVCVCSSKWPAALP